MIRFAVLLLTTTFAFAETYEVVDKFPRSVDVGDKISFERSLQNGENTIVVKVNGETVEGQIILPPMGKNIEPVSEKKRYDIKAEKAGKLEITIIIYGDGKKTTDKHTIEVK